MKINEIALKTPIKIRAVLGKNFLEFDSIVLEKENDTILISPIVSQEGKVVNLSSDKVSLQLVYIDESSSGKLPIIWDIKVRYVRKNKQYYHQIIQLNNSKSINRRNAFRLHIGEIADLKLMAKKEILSVTLKDISSSGFSFVYGEDMDLTSNGCTIITNIDGKNLTLNGTIVRKQPIENGRYIYGCKLPKYSQELDKFISTKQRERLMKQRQKR